MLGHQNRYSYVYAVRKGFVFLGGNYIFFVFFKEMKKSDPAVVNSLNGLFVRRFGLMITLLCLNKNPLTAKHMDSPEPV